MSSLTLGALLKQPVQRVALEVLKGEILIILLVVNLRFCLQLAHQKVEVGENLFPAVCLAGVVYL